MSKSKNDEAWEKLFQKHNLVSEINRKGFYEISSSSINEFREARLMTKFDFKSQLPSLFLEHSYSILPISRGKYIISSFETFKEFNNVDLIEPTKVQFPNYLESMDYNNITSESAALNCAYVSGMMEDFVGEEKLYPTVNGRMGSGIFNFKIDIQNQSSTLEINVNKAQLEIDGGLEGIESLYLIEAKNSISRDFLIRQLYYPFRLWNYKISKPIRNLFLTYTNGIFHFREYVFENINHYNSIRLLKQKKYVIYEGGITLDILKNTRKNIRVLSEPKIPFPQADSFERVINLCELLYENKFLTKEDITEKYDFDKRQTNYYTDAGRYLELIHKKKMDGQICFFLSPKGMDLFQLSMAKRQLKFIEILLSKKVFNQSLEYYFHNHQLPHKNEIVNIMKQANVYNIDSENTFRRRASTVASWMNWVLAQIEQ